MATTRLTILKEGLNAGWPICLGYLPIGMAFGVLAQKAGLTSLQIGLMSIMVFAGSSQFIAVSLLAAGASAPAIVTTTFVVNLRHVLMSSALAVYLRAAHRGWLALYAYGVTDESFAVNLSKFRDSQWNLNSALVTNQTANFTWIVTTVLGGIGQMAMMGFGVPTLLTTLAAGFVGFAVFASKNGGAPPAPAAPAPLPPAPAPPTGFVPASVPELGSDPAPAKALPLKTVPIASTAARTGKAPDRICGKIEPIPVKTAVRT